jgi:Fic family protein
MSAKSSVKTKKVAAHASGPSVAEAPKPKSFEDRYAAFEAQLSQLPEDVQNTFKNDIETSWILHDAALEGTVYTREELTMAVDANSAFVGDSSVQPICEEIRRHREAIHFIKDAASKKRVPVTIDVIKKIYVILHPEEGDIKLVKYRKDIPQHRLYFHEYAAPEKIANKVRQIVDWVNDPETKKSRNTLRIATRAHYDLLRVFPFQHDSGKVARLFMNLLLLRSGYPPAIVHSSERQRYYEALKGASANMNAIVAESLENGMLSFEKLIEHYFNRAKYIGR